VTAEAQQREQEDKVRTGREVLAAWMIEHSFSTGHGDTMDDLLRELAWQVEELRNYYPQGVRPFCEAVRDIFICNLRRGHQGDHMDLHPSGGKAGWRQM
jgi:hypothetical protein